MQRLVFYLVLPPILVLFAAELTLLGGMRLAYPGESPDPFVSYEAMMPGQWAIASGRLPCEPDVTPGYAITIFCDIDPTDRYTVSVASSASNGTFTQAWFNANDLVVADIVRHWGRPDVVVNYDHRSFHVIWWDEGLIGTIIPVGPAGQFNYLQPVEHFTIGLETRNLP